MTQADGAVCFASEYYPYGQELNSTSSCSTNYKFTGYERDTETGLDYAFARYYNPRMGRFMSGDPLGGGSSDPQSHNRYSYTRNNPVNLIDPSGLCAANDWWVGPECAVGSTFDWRLNGGGGPNDAGISIRMGGFGSAASYELGVGLTRYLEQIYGSGILRGPDGALYRLYSGSVTYPVLICEDPVGHVLNCQNGIAMDAYYTQVAVGQSPGDSGNSSWWSTFGSTFVNGVLHGVRQPGQSFGACILQNADETTFGGHKAVIGAVIATAAAAAADAPSVQVLPNEPPVSGALNIALYAGRFVYLASAGLISGRTVIAPIAKGIRAAGRAAPYVAAAEAGLLIGSAINCR